MLRAIVVTLVVLPAMLSAQTIRGLVIDRGSNAELPGVVVLMVDAAGNTVGRALTNERGEYRVSAPRAGTYRLQALRIGFRPGMSDPVSLRLDDDITQLLSLAGIRVSLDTVHVTGRNACRMAGASGAEAYAVWEQALTALTALQLTNRQRAINATTVGYERMLDRSARRIWQQRSNVRSDLVTQPWRSVTPDSLHRVGYVVTGSDDSTTYYAPGLEVLLSSEFVEDHCFRLARSSDPKRLGIAFEPTPDRKRVPEIEGTLWLDRASAELRGLDFRYVNVPYWQRERSGGSMDFVRMRDGTWAISRWNIRMPVVALTSARFGGRDRKVAAIKVSGGELVVARRSGDTLWSRPPLVLAGTVVDSVSGSAVFGAGVTLQGTRLQSVTDVAGRFAIAGVLPGEYTVETRTPLLDSVGAVHESSLSFTDSTASIQIRVQTPKQIAQALCGDMFLASRLSTDGIVLGTIDTRDDSVPLNNVRVVAEWGGVWPQVLYLDAHTDERGAYRICGVPLGKTLYIRAETGGARAGPVTVRVGPGDRFTRAELTLDRRGVSGATFMGVVRADTTRNPIKDAEVALPELSMSVLTNEWGSFRFHGIPPGDHNVVIRRSGYRQETLRILFSGGRAVERKVFLKGMSPTDQDVSARRPVLPDSETKRNIGAEPGTMPAGTGTIVGLVTTQSGQQLPYADVTIEREGLAAFTGVQGRFEFRGVLAGATQIRVRRLGFMPTTVTVTVAAGRTDSINVVLPPLALQLDRVRVTDAVCPNRIDARIDTAVVSILQQVQMNGERSRLLAFAYPFESTMERTIGNEVTDTLLAAVGSTTRTRADTIRVDTIALSSEHEWRYAPGKLIVPDTTNKDIGARDKMIVPQLVDFADEAFVAAHCFRYAGVETVDDRRLLRVDFEPIKGLREPDVRGSLYLDTLSYQIQRSTLYLERPSPLAPARDTWEVRVDTWFREILPSLPVIDRISERTTVRSVFAPGRPSSQAATEDHRLLDLRFLGQKPGEPD